MNSNREEAIFALALTKSPAERSAWLDRECGNDASLRHRLETLLAANDEPDELSPKDAPAAVKTMKLEFADAPDEAVGQTLGYYKLLQKIGEGGCGVVYVAEQTEPVRRRVALKVIKLGMDTKQVVARFEAERQALAMMDHPNIAKVLDARITAAPRSDGHQFPCANNFESSRQTCPASPSTNTMNKHHPQNSAARQIETIISRRRLFRRAIFSAAWLGLLLSSVAISNADDDPGHSRHGTAFDSGLRQRPWKMEGIGHTHFPITTKVPEVQEWFDQGTTLLHSFWWEEAERSFRWCLKLDPDCAMAYWGLARCGSPGDGPDSKRYLDFLNEAIRRKDKCSPRERLYIEAWEAAFTGDALTLSDKERQSILAKRLQLLVLKYPEDIEAKALFALVSFGGDHALTTELLIQQILAKEPDHPGAHHYRIHNWDGVAPEQGLPSCLRYSLIVSNIGHADHMPGHNYTKMGLWHEAARSMDTATRTELRYMNRQLALPFETWNYAHNRNYLCYIQEQLGLADASLQGARDLLASPRDPERNKDNNYGAFDQGMMALVRALLKFERWDAVLTTSNSAAIPWRDIPSDKDLRAFAETLAYVGKGDLPKARVRLQELKTGLRQRKDATNDTEAAWAIGIKSAEGILLAAEGNLLDATGLLADAAALEKKQREADQYINDPPGNPWPVNRVLGDVYLNRGEHRLAVEAYERALVQEPYDAFTLSGLARAHFALGERAKAENDYGRLLHVWSGANTNLRWMSSVTALGLKAAPVVPTLAPERPYRTDTLAHLGPLNWEPYAAPELDCLDVNREHVHLKDYLGKNVLLIFYLNDECVHCMEQLQAINKRAEDWLSENTVVLGVSSVSPEKNKESSKLSKLPMRLLSDHDHVNARRFASYDDFEDLELHSTILIDTKGRVHWKRTGGAPFADVEFLLQSVKRMNEAAAAQTNSVAVKNDPDKPAAPAGTVAQRP